MPHSAVARQRECARLRGFRVLSSLAWGKREVAAVREALSGRSILRRQGCRSTATRRRRRRDELNLQPLPPPSPSTLVIPRGSIALPSGFASTLRASTFARLTERHVHLVAVLLPHHLVQTAQLGVNLLIALRLQRARALIFPSLSFPPAPSPLFFPLFPSSSSSAPFFFFPSSSSSSEA